MRNRHAAVWNIATWAQEYFRKPLPFTTVCCCIKKCNLNLLKRRWKCVPWYDEFTFQLVSGKNGCPVLSPKDQRDHPDFHQQQMQKQASVVEWWCSRANSMVTGICAKVPYTGIVQRHAAIKMMPFTGRPWLDQDNARYHSECATTVWFRRDRVNVLDRLVCSIKQWSVNVLWCVTSVSYWKCMAHHEKENQTMTLTDCWASEVLNQARLDKDFACKTLTISILNSQTTNIAIMRNVDETHASVLAFLECAAIKINICLYIKN